MTEKNKIELELLVEELREVLSERESEIIPMREEIDRLRYDLHKAREACFKVISATAGALPAGYSAALEAAEMKMLKPKKTNSKNVAA
jgi:hypothetical protein